MPRTKSCALILSTILALCLPAGPTSADPATVASPVPTNNASAKIATAYTYQQLLPSVPVGSGARRSLTVQNNNATDTCWVIVGTTQITPATTVTNTNITIGGATVTAAQASIELLAGASYTRYYPYSPSDIIYGTCQTAGDSIYVDTQ
jgi:FtsP/CotA-like multicopper oxidase with cupredoxin domain